MQAAGELFRRYCAKCHGADGTARAGRLSMPSIPDLTDGPWHGRRSEAKLLASILDGRGDDMPPFRAKISADQAHSLVAYVRAFAPTRGRTGLDKQDNLAASQLDKPFGRLTEELDELKRQYRQLSKPSPDPVPSKPAEVPPRPAPDPSAPRAPGQETASQLFQKHCEKCHGADGAGRAVRVSMPGIPDLTNGPWQGRRSEAQLLVSILDGKGDDMPPFAAKISAEQARGLVAYVRAFAPTPEEAGREQEETTSVQPEETKAPGGFSAKLIGWLGKFHPPTVHFPIALLTAAALAEVLRMATGQRIYAASSRFCIWFGFLTAVIAVVLGWFLGGFRLTDTSWVLMTHRWLGTATVVCAGLLLVLSEGSQYPDRRRTRLWFRVSLLVVVQLILATGFLGGALVFGLDHYAWPP